MKSALQLKLDLDEAEKLEGEQRLGALRMVRDGIIAIEMAAGRDFNFPLTEIQAGLDLLPRVDGGIRRLEAGLKRRKEKAA